MTLEEAEIHIEYIKISKPKYFKEIGITDNIMSNKALVSEAAEIATQSHWGASDISEEELFDKILTRLIEESKLENK